MAQQSFQVIGLRETYANLAQFEKQYTSKVASVALRALNFRILDAVRDATYTTFNQRTGLIRSGLGVRTQKKIHSDKIVSFVVENPQTPFTMNKIQFRSVARRPRAAGSLPPRTWVAFYWRFLEFGTNPRSLESNGANRGTGPERSWVRPAFNQALSGALDRFAKISQEMTDEICAKLPPTVPGRSKN